MSFEDLLKKIAEAISEFEESNNNEKIIGCYVAHPDTPLFEKDQYYEWNGMEFNHRIGLTVSFD